MVMKPKGYFSLIPITQQTTVNISAIIAKREWSTDLFRRFIFNHKKIRDYIRGSCIASLKSYGVDATRIDSSLFNIGKKFRDCFTI